MADKNLKARIGLRRGLEAEFDASFIPLKGEILLVDTNNYGLRVKVGTGNTTFKNLPYQDENNNVVLTGYYLNGEFYTDSTYTTKLEHSNVKLYIDKNSGKLYIYLGDGVGFENVNPDLPQASSSVAGIMKLYDSQGNKTDGTMTQKSITDGIDDIVFSVSKDDPECLILNKPW